MAELNQKQALRFYKPGHFPYTLPLLRVKFKHPSLNMNLYHLFSLSIHASPPPDPFTCLCTFREAAPSSFQAKLTLSPSPALRRPFCDLPWRSKGQLLAYLFATQPKLGIPSLPEPFWVFVAALSLQGLLCEGKPEPPSPQPANIPRSSHPKTTSRQTKEPLSIPFSFQPAPFSPSAPFPGGDLSSPGPSSSASLPHPAQPAASAPSAPSTQTASAQVTGDSISLNPQGTVRLPPAWSFCLSPLLTILSLGLPDTPFVPSPTALPASSPFPLSVPPPPKLGGLSWVLVSSHHALPLVTPTD